jgi:hypothetical protein
MTSAATSGRVRVVFELVIGTGMKKRDVEVCMRVEITGIPFKGRTGVVRGKSRLMGFTSVWEIWCDHPDALGRKLVRVSSYGIRPMPDNPTTV